MEFCGIVKGYLAHRKANEETCGECRKAWREYVRSKRTRRRDRCGCGSLKSAEANVCQKCSISAASKAAGNARRAKRIAHAQLVHVGEVPFTWLPAQHPVLRQQTPPRRRVFVAGLCAYCGTGFMTLTTTGSARFCSTKCCKYMSRTKSGTRFRTSPLVRLAIYDRDLWICQLCDEGVDRDLMTLDPSGDWAPTLDHIIPQSKGGTHEPENLRLAHRWCNSVRGDDSHYTASDLKRAA